MNLPLMIAYRRHAPYGHVCRPLPETPAHRALLLSNNVPNGDRPGPEWKRSRGRPKRRWLRQIDEDFGASVGAANTTLPTIGQFGDRYDPPPVMRDRE